jgi:hypothetical protein
MPAAGSPIPLNGRLPERLKTEGTAAVARDGSLFPTAWPPGNRYFSP